MTRVRDYRLPLTIVVLAVVAGGVSTLAIGPSALLAWLMLPLDGASSHEIAPWAAWHGRLMVLSWGVMLPIGVLVARYFKVTPAQRWPAQLDNQSWWNWHRWLQYSGLALALLGVALAWQGARGATSLATVHGWMGWTVLALGLTQVVGGILRGTKGGPTGEGAARGNLSGDHYDMTARRVLFEMLHKGGGYCAIVLALVTILVGLSMADAPRWMGIVILGWWLQASCS